MLPRVIVPLTIIAIVAVTGHPAINPVNVTLNVPLPDILGQKDGENGEFHSCSTLPSPKPQKALPSGSY